MKMLGFVEKGFEDMDVSENSGTPKSSHFTRVFYYKPSILGYSYFWKHPYEVLGAKETFFEDSGVKDFFFFKRIFLGETCE